MNAAKMVNDKITQLEDAVGNHLDTRLMRDIMLFLDAVSIQMEKDDHKLALGLKRVNSFRVVESMSDEQRTIEQIKVMNRDHNTTPHHQYDEWESI